MLVFDRFDMTRWVKGCLAFLFVGGLCLLITGSAPAREDRDNHQLLSNYGIPTSAKVVSRFYRYSRGTHYRLTYRYEVDGKSYDGGDDVDVDKDVYDQHPEGSTLEIRYLPSDPDVSSSDPGGWLSHDLLSRVASWVFTLMGASGLVCAGLSARAQMQDRA